MKIGVVGASGYAGGELLRMLDGHPDFEAAYVAAGSNAGELITSIHSHLTSYSGKSFAATSVGEINKCDLIFLALPHGESASLVKEIDKGVKVVEDRKSTRLNSSHVSESRMPSSA